MNRRIVISTIGAVLVLSLSVLGAYRLGARAGAGRGAPVAAKVLYWHDPMVPDQKFDKPGKSPFMDMALVPVYADEGQAPGGVAVSPGVQQNLGIRIAAVRKGALAGTLDTVANVAFDERELVQLQARSSGYVEKLFVRAPLEPVRKGQALLQLYAPDWVAAQEEYLAISRMPAGADTAGLLDAALQRMRLAGMTATQIRQVSARAQVSPRITVTAPADGVVSELSVREGMTVTPGAPLFRINGLRTVWVNAEVPESAAARVRPGMAVRATSPAFPGAEFGGKVEALLPEVNTATRTLKARIVLANPGGKLVPGMFATIHMMPAPGRETLLVPSEAVIQTGERTVVITQSGDGSFAPADVVTGTEADGQTEVLKGLKEGEKVVASGQFLIDSEASLRGTLRRIGGAASPVPARAAPAAAPAPAPAPATHHAAGKVERIARDEVTISHGPIPSLKWPAMTMGFMPPAGGLAQDIRVGDTVRFEIRATHAGRYEIVSIARDAAAPGGAR
ncbi:efflux RND transporter periplasmic adaptor subunit [Massilia luteola]|uniref:efflux RND transporter periplasmic adaptor subunit n=1 Tax=Massilia luteola TaxID=3081751 RepID=UPI002ACC09A7|nr:efflux RND transporter periplasmic adaptor subunit [Massilia sp. Gc5]